MCELCHAEHHISPPHRYKIRSASLFLMPENIIWITYKEKCLIPLKMKHILASWMQAVPVQRVISAEPAGVLFYPYTGLRGLLVTFPKREEPLFDQGTVKVATHWDLPNSHSSFQL